MTWEGKWVPNAGSQGVMGRSVGAPCPRIETSTRREWPKRVAAATHRVHLPSGKAPQGSLSARSYQAHPGLLSPWWSLSQASNPHLRPRRRAGAEPGGQEASLSRSRQGRTWVPGSMSSPLPRRRSPPSLVKSVEAVPFLAQGDLSRTRRTRHEERPGACTSMLPVVRRVAGVDMPLPARSLRSGLECGVGV